MKRRPVRSICWGASNLLLGAVADPESPAPKILGRWRTRSGKPSKFLSPPFLWGPAGRVALSAGSIRAEHRPVPLRHGQALPDPFTLDPALRPGFVLHDCRLGGCERLPPLGFFEPGTLPPEVQKRAGLSDSKRRAQEAAGRTAVLPGSRPTNKAVEFGKG